MSNDPGEPGLNPGPAGESVYDEKLHDQSTHALSLAQAEGLELAEQLGSGRGTRTWLAKEEQSREKFTVTFATGPTAEERRPQQQAMARVAEQWAGVTHPHLVPVRGTIQAVDGAEGMAGVDVVEAMEGVAAVEGMDGVDVLEGGAGVEALVCDHVEGISLSRRIAQDGRVPPAELSPVLTAVANALATLHDHGWVHGTLSPNSILLGQGQTVWLDGYGLPVTREPDATAYPNATAKEQPTAQAVVSWGHDDRPEMLDRSVARTPADDVKALATLAWVALTGRAPGSDSHRVPLTLVCPAAPRGLVLMLESALSDEPESRPSAHEFATGIAAIPTAKTAPRVARLQTPHIIRADGTEVKLGRTWRPTTRRGSSAVAATVADDRSWRRPLVLALAATALVGCAWFGVAELTGGEPTPVAADQELSEAAGSETEGTGSEGTGSEKRGADSSMTEDSVSGTPGEKEGTTPSTRDEAASSAAAGSDAQNQKAAELAARQLVASRAQALAAGDGEALAAVYIPGSQLAESDQSTIAHAASQKGGASDYTALSGLSMEVDRIEPASAAEPELAPDNEIRDEDAHTFYAEILTRGWHGEIPEGSHVNREDTTVRQTVHLTVVETDSGWRIVDVTPVKRNG